MASQSCDVAIIGAGTAGLSAERAARAEGASTLLIDSAFAGTTCATVGCMPSKLLIAAANVAHRAAHADQFGVKTTVEIDGAAVMTRVRAYRDEFVAGIQKQFETLPEGVRRKARARFDGPDQLSLDDGSRIKAKAVVIATGARPSIPDFLADVQHAVLTNETIFDLRHLPRSVGVIGAGPLGLELAQALARLGVKVAIFDEGDALAGIKDPELANSLPDSLAAEFPIHLAVKLSARPTGKSVALSWTGRSNGSAEFDYILAAAGRPPELGNLGLETTGLQLDRHGAPHVDPATMQCGKASIFAAGDAEHSRPVLHEAEAEGKIAGRNAARFPCVEAVKRTTPLAIMFTDPAMAIVGMAPEDRKTVCGSASYADQGRAKIFATNAGLVKIYADAKTGELLAAQMVGPAVEHTAHLLTWAIQKAMSAADLLAMPFYHPSYEEGLKPALQEICNAIGKKI